MPPLPPTLASSPPPNNYSAPAAKRPKFMNPYQAQLPLLPTPTGGASGPPPPHNVTTAMLPPPPPSQGQSSGGGGGSQPQKATDTVELADALASAGIDIREEEAHLSIVAHTPTNALESLNLRRQAELRANHSQNPFLNIRALQTRIRTKAREQNLTLGVATQQQAQGAVGIVSQDLTTYLSLAIRERLAGLVSRSVVLSRQRKLPNGLIGGEWGALVKGGDKHQTTVNGDSALAHNPLKRSFSNFSQTQGPTTITTTNIANETARALRSIAQQELQAEQQRIQLKTSRANNASGTNPSTPGDSSGGIAGDPPTPGSMGGASTPNPGGDPDFPKKMSAKESRKHQDSRIQEAVAHRAANSTAAMMMGGGGFGKKKGKKTYAWMIAGPGSGGPNSPAAGVGGGGGSASGGANPLVRSNSASDLNIGGGDVATSVWGRRIGEWREDGEKGQGIQIRDWVGALEADGREKKAVVKAYLKMK